MKKFHVQLSLEALGEARAKWRAESTKFESEFSAILSRLIYEAAANYMSAEEVGRLVGLSTAQVKKKMKAMGMNPTSGKTLLAKTAADALIENAALLGVEPSEMDLTSPLAYLPMGSEMRAFLETPGVSALDEPRDKVAEVLYQEHFDREDGEWLSTSDGSPNAASYALADKILAALDEK